MSVEVGGGGSGGSGFTPKGAWDSATTYNPGDLVSYGGGSYVAAVTNVNAQPDLNPTDWTQIAAPGSGGNFTVTASKASPALITTQITVAHVTREYKFVKGSGGAVTLSATPKIQAGTVVGQELILEGCDDTNTVFWTSGSGTDINGAIILRNGSRIYLVWNGTTWGEVARDNI